MTIGFTVADDAPDPRTRAIVSARQLAAFRSFAASQTERFGIVVVHSATQAFGLHDFEARVCPFALAAVAPIFDYDETAIGVIEEAQYLGRLIRVGRDREAGTIHLKVSPSPTIRSD